MAFPNQFILCKRVKAPFAGNRPMLRREMCGADAGASFQRDAFGLTAGKDYGLKMDVVLCIQVEAVAVP